MMSSAASMVSKPQPEFKGPPDYWVTPKWLFHINKDGEFFQLSSRGGGGAKRPKKIFGSFRGGGGRKAPEEKFSTKSCNVPGKSLVASRMVPNGAHIGKSHSIPNGRHRSLVMSRMA